MTAWAVIGLLFAAAIFATIPISPQLTPRAKKRHSQRRKRCCGRRPLCGIEVP